MTADENADQGPHRLTVAVAQAISVPGAVEDNIRRSSQLIERYHERGVELMVFAELSLVDYELSQFERPEVWVADDDPRLDRLREQCRTSGVHAVVGAGVRTSDGRRLLASLFIGADGGLIVQGKTHLHGPEREVFESAAPGPVVDVGGWSTALAVGHDAAVPGHAQAAAAAGAELYLVSAWYDAHEHERMGIHLASRAMDHRMFVLGANHARTPQRDSCGGSGIWGPDGSSNGRAGFSVQVMVTEIDRARSAALREADRAAADPLA